MILSGGTFCLMSGICQQIEPRCKILLCIQTFHRVVHICCCIGDVEAHCVVIDGVLSRSISLKLGHKRLLCLVLVVVLIVAVGRDE